MKLTKIVQSLAVAGTLALGSSGANALIVEDSWKLDFTGLGWNSVTSNIGHLNLSGGTGTVTQQLGVNGLPDIGEAFTEFGAIYSLTVTQNNAIGMGDSGSSAAFTAFLYDSSNFIFARPDLEIVYTGLTGKLTSVDGSGAVTYAFDPGVGAITVRARLVDALASGVVALTGYTDVATFSLVNPSGGSLGNFLGGNVPNGTTDALSIEVGDPYGIFKDSAGNTLLSTALDPLFGILHTDNKLIGQSSVTCDEETEECAAVFQVRSDGSFDIARIPEPGTVALLGIAILGLASVRRMKDAK